MRARPCIANVTRALVCVALLAPALPARADDPFPDGQKAFDKARALLSREYVDAAKVSDDKLWRAATAGLFAAGGSQWDRLLSPSEVAALKADLAGEVVGLGVRIDVDESAGIANVLGVVPGSGAERAGLAVGDKIIKLDGKSLRGLSTDEVARSMRGKAGTRATLTILRDTEILTRTIRRAPFTLDPVTTLTLPDGVGLVQLRAFTEKTPALLRAAIERLRKPGLRALVIDLRDNEGGAYERMIDCAGELLPKGALVVTALHRGGRVEERHTTTEPLVSLPMAALINGATASGAEILAAALQHAGARLVGKRTRGKWNAQNLEDLGNGWVARYTTLVFRAPSGALPDGKGIEPDVEVELDPKATARALGTRDPAGRLAVDAQLRVAVSLIKLSR